MKFFNKINILLIVTIILLILIYYFSNKTIERYKNKLVEPLQKFRNENTGIDKTLNELKDDLNTTETDIKNLNEEYANKPWYCAHIKATNTSHKGTWDADEAMSYLGKQKWGNSQLITPMEPYGNEKKLGYAPPWFINLPYKKKNMWWWDFKDIKSMTDKCYEVRDQIRPKIPGVDVKLNEQKKIEENIRDKTEKLKEINVKIETVTEQQRVAAAAAERERALAEAKAKADAAEKKQIELYQNQIKDLSIDIKKFVIQADKQKNILKSTQDKVSQQQITGVIKPDITDDMTDINNNNNSIQEILNNFNNSKEETLNNLNKSKKLLIDSQEKIRIIQDSVKKYKTTVEQKILSINAEKERQEKLQKEREQLLNDGQQFKNKLKSLETTKSQLQAEISNLENNGLNSESKIKSINSEILDTKNKNSEIDSKINQYKIKKYASIVNKNISNIDDIYPQIISDNNNNQNDDKNIPPENIEGFTTITNILSNKPYQRNILSKNNIIDEYD